MYKPINRNIVYINENYKNKLPQQNSGVVSSFLVLGKNYNNVDLQKRS